jgi:hypothetical protein
LQGNTGIFFKAKSSLYCVVMKDFIVGNRLYQFGIMRQDRYPTDKEVNAFHNSFEIVK